MELYIKISQIAFPLLSVAVIITGWRAQRKSDKLKIVETQLSQMKTEAYGGVYSFFFDLIRDVKTNRVNEKEAHKRLLKIKETILSYGSDEVVNSLSIWLRLSQSTLAPYEKMHTLGRLLLSIRKDMGYPKTKLTEDDLLLYIMQDEDEVEKFKNWDSEADKP